jgi:hypothetical protein
VRQVRVTENVRGVDGRPHQGDGLDAGTSAEPGQLDHVPGQDLRERLVAQVPTPDCGQRLLPAQRRPLVKERGLALEVVEHRRASHVGLFGDLVHGGGLEATLDE